MSTQIALSSLPEHVQAKYILLLILPRNQPASIAFLCHLWQCSEQVTCDTIVSLLFVHLVYVGATTTSKLSQSRPADSDSSTLRIFLHTCHYDYLEKLINHSTMWLNRVHLAVERCMTYILNPQCLAPMESLNSTSSTFLELDTYFFPPIKLHYDRLGHYWRRVITASRFRLIS